MRPTARSSTILLLSALMIAPVPAPAQRAAGRIVGQILDASSGQGLAYAGIHVAGTAVGTVSGVDGRFALSGVTEGAITLVVRRVGYTEKAVTGITVPAGRTLEQNIALLPASVALAAAVVTASAERGTVAEAMDFQKLSTNVVSAITAEQIARSPDGDAAQTVQRVSGVTVQDGKYVQVRGLGERYTTAALNGVRLPSPEPERKVVPFDLFPSGLLQSVITLKTFTPDLPGDFSGAQVDIRTREFPAERQVNYSLSVGANDRVAGRMLPVAPRQAGDVLGMAGAARNIPQAIARTNFGSVVPQGAYNAMVRTQRNVWSAQRATGAPSIAAGMSMGGSEVFGRRIGYLVSTTYGIADEVRDDESHAVGNAGPGGSVSPLTQLRGATGRRTVQWGALATVSALAGRATRVSLYATATRSADSEARVDRGFDENLADSVARTTLRYVERGMVTANLRGEHQWNGRHRTDWSAAYGYTTHREPDRSDVVYAREATGTYQLLASLDGARRLWFDLDEQNVVVEASHQTLLGREPSRHSLKAGGYVRRTTRDADAPMFAFLTRAGAAVTSQPAERVFAPDQACDTCALVYVQPIGQAGSYDATDNTLAGYALLDLGVGERLHVVAGARYEYDRIRVNSTTQAGGDARAAANNGDVLPAVILTTQLSPSQLVRVAVTQTVGRPEYRELAPVTFRDVLGGVSVTGNNRLQRTRIANFDARWEWYPGPAEVISVGVFAKAFDKPIERVEQATSGAYQATFQNARRGSIGGVEVELRKDLDALGSPFHGVTAFANATLMRSQVELDSAQAQTVTDTRRAMVGQAPYVVNAGVTWTTRTGASSATLLYNVMGERIIAAGVRPLPNIVERPRHVVDAAVRVPVTARLSARFDVKNLLDPRYRFMQGNLEREGYRTGRTYAVGMSWKP